MRGNIKIKSSRTCHIAMRMAQTPTLIIIFLDLTTPLSQFPNKCAILKGGVILKHMQTIFQIIFAKGQLMKRCCIDSS
jgi:hypothetical protein